MSTTKGEDYTTRFTCCLSEDDYIHYLFEPMYLLCGHNACLDCLQDIECLDLNKNQIECYHCKSLIKEDDVTNKKRNPVIESVVLAYLNLNLYDLNDYLDADIKKSIDSLKG